MNKKAVIRGFPKTSVFGKATLDLGEKADFRPLFQEHFPKLTKFWKILTLLLLAFAALPLFANGQQDSSAPFNDHELVAVHRIHMREVVRIGVPSNNSPFSSVDAKGVWQGYDVYFAHRIAKEILDDKEKYLRFVPVSRENWVEYLENDQVDIVLGFGPNPEQAAPADFALPYRKDGEARIAPAVRKGNGELQLWLNDVISRRVEAGFFHKNFEATLRPVYGAAVDPETLVIERGGTKP